MAFEDTMCVRDVLTSGRMLVICLIIFEMKFTRRRLVKTRLSIEVSDVISTFERSHDAFCSGVIVLATILQSTNDYNDNNLKAFSKTISLDVAFSSMA
jgi:hypothetical protein